jgi:hypothetical protein
MKSIKVHAALLFTILSATAANAATPADTAVIGVAPVCPYGYYDRAPYDCAPYGYYGAEWFSGGIFIGVGPWFHGATDFRGHVDVNLDTQHGYSGQLPQHGDMPDPAKRLDKIADFKGNGVMNSQGRVEATEQRKPVRKVAK